MSAVHPKLLSIAHICCIKRDELICAGQLRDVLGLHSSDPQFLNEYRYYSSRSVVNTTVVDTEVTTVSRYNTDNPNVVVWFRSVIG